jgi:hypothetical protein
MLYKPLLRFFLRYLQAKIEYIIFFIHSLILFSSLDSCSLILDGRKLYLNLNKRVNSIKNLILIELYFDSSYSFVKTHPSFLMAPDKKYDTNKRFIIYIFKSYGKEFPYLEGDVF